MARRPDRRPLGPGPFVPGARIYELDEGGASEVGWEACDPTRLTRAFLDAPDRFLRDVVGD